MTFDISISADESAQGKMRGSTLDQAITAFQAQGVLVLRNVFDPCLIGTLHQEYLRRYGDLAALERDPRYSQVGEGRYMISVEINGAFSDPTVYANPFIYPILKALLGPDFIISSYGSVIAFPGSAAQHVHVDHPLLFPAEAISVEIPCYAITLAIPLIEIDATVGGTRVWPGTHRRLIQAKVVETTEPALLPRVGLGGCYFMDYRLLHGGADNAGAVARPLLYIVYSRPWFRDSANFSSQPPVILSREEYAKVSEPLRHLFQ